MLTLRREMLKVMQQGGWLAPGTDLIDGIANPHSEHNLLPRHLRRIRERGARGGWTGASPRWRTDEKVRGGLHPPREPDGVGAQRAAVDLMVPPPRRLDVAPALRERRRVEDDDVEFSRT